MKLNSCQFVKFVSIRSLMRPPRHIGGYNPSFLNRFFTSLKWKSSEQSFSSSPFLKCLATSGSALSCFEEIGVVAAGVFDFPGLHRGVWTSS